MTLSDILQLKRVFNPSFNTCLMPHLFKDTMLLLKHSVFTFVILLRFAHTISIDVRKNEQRFRRVISDQIAVPHSRPWIAELKMNGKHLCGASIIMRPPHQFSVPQTGKTDVLLTAAHCVLDSKPNTSLPEFSVNPKRIKAHFGKHNSIDDEPWETVIGISHTLVNPRFRNRAVVGYDIALLKMERPVEFNEIIQPIALSPFPLSATSNCSVAGWGRRLKFSDSTDLTVLDLPNINDFGAVLMEKFSSFEKSTWPGDSGSPVTCYKDGLPYVQGIVSISRFATDPYELKYLGVEYCNFTSILDNIPWLMESLDMIDQMSTTVYHSDFLGHIVNVNANFGSYIRRAEADHRLDEFYGEKIISHNRRLDLPGSNQIDHLDIWFEDSVHDIVNVDHGMPSLSDIFGYTEREGPAQCAAECYLFNGGRPCTYSIRLKRCYFASIEHPDLDHNNPIRKFSIHFTFADNIVKQRWNISEMITSEKEFQSHDVQQLIWNVSVILSAEVEYHCTGRLISLNTGTYTQINVSKACLIELMSELNRWNAEVDAKIIAVVADGVHSSPLNFHPTDLRNNVSFLQLSLVSPIYLNENFENELERSFHAPEMPSMKRYNPFSGSVRRRFLKLPYLFQFTMLDGRHCYGSIMNETYFSRNSTDKQSRFILTTATCALALRKDVNDQETTITSRTSYIREETFIERKIHIHPHFNNSILSNNIAILESRDPIFFDEYVGPFKFRTVYHSGFENLSILVRNNEYNDNAGWSSSKEIPVEISYGMNENKTNVVTKRTLYKQAMTDLHNTEDYIGCPLAEYDSQSGTLEMVGMVCATIKKDAEYIESHVLFESFIPWMQEIVAGSNIID